MKTYYLFSRRLSLFSVLGILAITATSCGSYQNSSYYDDGIYGGSENRQTVNTATNNSESNKYKEYFSNPDQEIVIFTDVDSYSNVSNDSVSKGQVYNNSNAGWGDNAQSITVNVYDNNWGWGYWNNYWYGSYWGWGWNSWYGPGWGFGWNNWYGPNWGLGWGWGWNSWNNWYGPGWGGYYGHNHWGSYYNGGRRGTNYPSYYGNRLNSSYNNRYQSNGVRSNRNFTTPRNNNFNTRPNSTPVRSNNTPTRTNTNAAPTRTNINNSSSQPRNSVRTQTQSAPSRSYAPSSSYGGGRSSGGGSYGGGRSSGGGRR